MKKLLSMLCIAAALLMCPQKSKAAPGCVMYWTPVLGFFADGGSITVHPTTGADYSVTPQNVDPNGKYPLNAGDYLYVWPANCARYVWGSVIFCPCNSQGGVTCAVAPGYGNMEVGAVEFQQWVAWAICDCPNGSSSGGIHFIYQKPCQQAPPPPPQ